MLYICFAFKDQGAQTALGWVSPEFCVLR